MVAAGALRAVLGAIVVLTLAAGATVTCRRPPARDGSPPAGLGPSRAGGLTSGPSASWVYQLQGYPDGRLDALARTPQRLAVIDLARDAAADYFTVDEIGALQKSGKKVLAYFEIGTLEDFRPEHSAVRERAGDLILNRWADWPNEHFARYWDARWWDMVVRPRLDQALRAGFDGAYLDTPLAYEEVDLALTGGPGWGGGVMEKPSRDGLARAMVALIAKISGYAKARRPGFWIVPQNSPELRRYPGYTAAIDGIGMEELFFRATDSPCTESFCGENLAGARALRDGGKFVLAVDYATRPDHTSTACARYRTERFTGYVAVRELDRISPPC